MKLFDLLPGALKSNGLYDFAFKIIYFSGYDGTKGPISEFLGGPEGSNSFVTDVTIIDKSGGQFGSVSLNMSMPYEQALHVLDIVSAGDAIDIEWGYMPNMTRRLQAGAKGNPVTAATLGPTSTLTLEFAAQGYAMLGKITKAYQDVTQFEGQTLDKIAETIFGEYGFGADEIIYHHSKSSEESIKIPFEIDGRTSADKLDLPTRNGTETDWKYIQKVASVVGLVPNPQFGEIHFQPIKDEVKSSDMKQSLINFTMYGILAQAVGGRTVAEDLTSISLSKTAPTLPLISLNYNAKLLSIMNKPDFGTWDLKQGGESYSGHADIQIENTSSGTRGDDDTLASNSEGTGDADITGKNQDVGTEEGEHSYIASGVNVRQTENATGIGAANLHKSVWKQLNAQPGIKFQTIGFPTARVNMLCALNNCGRLDSTYRIFEIEHKFGGSAYGMLVSLSPPDLVK
jgi:hypothetical protein